MLLSMTMTSSQTSDHVLEDQWRVSILMSRHVWWLFGKIVPGISWHQLTSFKTLVSSHTCVLFMHSTAQPFLPNPGWDVERRGLSLQRGIIFMHSTYPQFYHVLSIFACAWPGFLCWPSSCVDHWSLRRPASPDAAWNRHDILTDGEITVKLTLSNVQIPPCGFCCI